MIQKITPRMQQALRENRKLFLASDVWLDVLNETVDSQEEFQASKLQSNIDFTTRPGFAELAKITHTISQTAQNAEYDTAGTIPYKIFFQKFYLPAGKIVTSIQVYLRAPVTVVATVYIAREPDQAYPYTNIPLVLANSSKQIVGGADAVISFPFNNVFVEEGYHRIYVYNNVALSFFLKYQNTNVYANGNIGARAGYGVWLDENYVGDMYFKINYKDYAPSGYFRTARMDIGAAPVENGAFQIAASQPIGTSLSTDIYGYATSTDASPAVTILDAQDGQETPPYQFWEAEVTLGANDAGDASPLVDMVEFLYPSKIVKARENMKLFYAAEELQKSYAPLLANTNYQMSDIKILERIASGGEVTATFEDPQPDTIMRMISDNPLKNFRALLYLGADIEGFSSTDLLRFFTGMVKTGKYKPRLRRRVYSLGLTFQNPVLELKRKIPQPPETGLLSLANQSLNYEGTHVIDAMLDMIRGAARIPARYINIAFFDDARYTIGDAALPAEAFVVRRSNAAGLPDTRLKSPEELVKHLLPCCVIADVYITIDEDSRITVVKHDASAPAEAAWADEKLVKAGLDAVPVEDISEIDLGYDTLLYNAAMLGCSWDGSGNDWTSIATPYAYVDSTSADEFAMGKATFLSLMEKNMLEASKWLGPEANYNGETIAQNLTTRYVARFAYPPVVVRGVTVSMSEFVRTLGSVISYTSPEFAKFKRRGIAPSETKTFMLLSKKWDRGKNRMVFDLLELT